MGLFTQSSPRHSHQQSYRAMLYLVSFLSAVVLVSAQFGNQFNQFQQQNQLRNPSLARILSDKRAHTVAGDFAVAFKQEDGTTVNEESRSSDGQRRGSYSYYDDQGQQHTVEWQAGAGGFQILNANNLPVGPQLTPAQQQATAAAARAHQEAAARAAANQGQQEANQFNQPQFNQQQFNQLQFNQQQFNQQPQTPVFNTRFRNQPNQFQAQPQFQQRQQFAHPAPITFQTNNNVPALTPEVAQARAEHLRAHQQAQSQPQFQQPQPQVQQAPQFTHQPQFQQRQPFAHQAPARFSGNNDVPALTADVAQARAEHLRAHQQALQAAQSAAATAKPEHQGFQPKQQQQQFQPQPQQFQPQQNTFQQFQPKPSQFQPKP